MRRLSLILLVLLGTSDAIAQSWVNLTPGAGTMPAGRRNASAIHDPVDNRMVIFGGFTNGFVNDIWAFDLDSNTWTNLTPAPGPPAPAGRVTPASIYDAVGHRMITWSGQGNGTFFNDVWAFDLSANTWSQFTPTGGPPQIRYGVGHTWDPLAGELVTFAGFTNLGRFQDVWRFNAQAVTWSNVSPVTNPLARCLHAACYDAEKHRMIMYAGQNNAGPLEDIWALDLITNTWTELTPVVRPAARFFSPVVYDDANNRVTMFGGQGNFGLSNEAWVFDLWTNLWTQLAPAGTPPSQRAGSAAIYDGANDRMLIFGGIDTVVKNDVWALEGLSDTATPVADAPAAPVVLRPNFPNPFNPSTTVEYELPVRGPVQLRVYSVDGRLVRTLVDASEPAGLHRVTWNGRDDRNLAVASGVYLLRIDAAEAAQTRKMVLLK